MLFKPNRACLYVAAAATCLTTAPVQADEETGPGRVVANVSSLLTYTDNFYYQPNAKQSVTGFLLRPLVRFRAQTGKTTLDLKGNVEYATFTAPGSEDDYFDRTASLDLGWTPTFRNRFSLNGSVQHGHDPFGQVRTEGVPLVFSQELDQWDRTGGGLRYRYGAPSARVNAEVGVSTAKVNYTTNEAITEPLDYSYTTVDYNIFYNYTPKTALLVSFARTAEDFNTPFIDPTTLLPIPDSRSGNLYQGRIGIRWLATSKTSGDVRAGFRQRTFDNRPDSVQGFDWQAAVQWSPTTPLLLELKTARSEDQSYRGDTSVLDQKSTSFGLKRTVNRRSLFTFGLNDTRADFFGSGRNDETRGASVGIEYAALRSAIFVANVGYAMRDSTDPTLDYHRLGAFIGLRIGRPG